MEGYIFEKEKFLTTKKLCDGFPAFWKHRVGNDSR